MKAKEARSLKTGVEVNHKRYGKAEVKEVLECGSDLFGVVIIPKTAQGLERLALDSGTDISAYLEASPRQLEYCGE